MWVLPKNYQLSSAFAQDMLESKEDLTLLESSIESSLMWRSKPSPLQTWSRRWNRVSWIQPLFTRILKPSHHTSFEEALTSSLEGIRVSRSQRQESDKEQTTLDTYGRSSGSMSGQLDLLGASLKTSKAISRLESAQSLATWKKMVTDARSEYSARLKSVRRTKESASLSWRTPSATAGWWANAGGRPPS